MAGLECSAAEREGLWELGAVLPLCCLWARRRKSTSWRRAATCPAISFRGKMDSSTLINLRNRHINISSRFGRRSPGSVPIKEILHERRLFRRPVGDTILGQRLDPGFWSEGGGFTIEVQCLHFDRGRRGRVYVYFWFSFLCDGQAGSSRDLAEQLLRLRSAAGPHHACAERCTVVLCRKTFANLFFSSDKSSVFKCTRCHRIRTTEDFGVGAGAGRSWEFSINTLWG